MILKGRTRADGGKLATYLLSPKNDRVRVLDISGTIIDDKNPRGLKEALAEMDELGKMTRAKSSLFHLAINPNDKDRMTPEAWSAAVSKAEKALGLEGHPRAVVSHVYEGKEHLHVVWSRVDVEQRKCAELSFSKLKLVQAAREIEIDLGLEQTPARARGAHRLKQEIKDIQVQQDGRSKKPRDKLNDDVAKAWAQSTNGQEFKKAIEAAGYGLAMGERYISVMDTELENYPVQRCIKGVRINDVRDKLGDLEGLPTLKEYREHARSETKTEKREETRSETTEAAAPQKTVLRTAANITAIQAERELSVDHENEPPAKLPTESEETYRARLKRWAEYDEEDRAKEEPKLEPHLRPQGRTFGR